MSLSILNQNLIQDTLCTAILGNVMLAITRSFHTFYPAVCADAHSITCCHLELFTPIIVSLVVLYRYVCITKKLHDHINVMKTYVVDLDRIILYHLIIYTALHCMNQLFHAYKHAIII